ncbi:MAG: hypothetical protein ACD_62C00015G0004 [uncultured bacterium]|nr:MAG: hypothetical protein ACD_62C00015G0004 [uncultured bacterium]HLD45745.1 hypothetical protein [bacterium]
MTEATTQSPQNPLPPYIPQDPPKKKGSGCGCFLAGCLVLIALILLPIIGGTIYVYSWNASDWGSHIVNIISHPQLVSSFKKAINDSPSFTVEQKQSLTKAYDSFLTVHKSLSEEQKEKLQKDIYITLKKIIADPEQFNQSPPPELIEIFTLLGMDKPNSPAAENSPNNPKTDQPLAIPQDPYSFVNSAVVPVTEQTTKPAEEQVDKQGPLQ